MDVGLSSFNDKNIVETILNGNPNPIPKSNNNEIIIYEMHLIRHRSRPSKEGA